MQLTLDTPIKNYRHEDRLCVTHVCLDCEYKRRPHCPNMCARNCLYMRLLHKNTTAQIFFPASSRAVSTTLIDNWMEDTLLCAVDGPRLCLNFNDPSQWERFARFVLFSLFITEEKNRWCAKKTVPASATDSFVNDVSYLMMTLQCVYELYVWNEPITFVRLTNYWYIFSFALLSHVNGVNVFVSKGIFVVNKWREE